MNRLQLATLLSWAGSGGVQGRKRLQKVVYFLQAAGCALQCRYTLHHFGPYSRDVADACDELVAARLAEETGGPSFSSPYTYTITADALKFLERAQDAAMTPFESLGKELIRAELWHLELGTTVLFFYCRCGNWDQALQRACEFKGEPTNAPSSVDALRLAQRVHAVGNPPRGKEIHV